MCDEKKAEEIVVLDVRKLTFVADFFVLCTTRNERQSRAIADGITTEFKKRGVRCLGSEGYTEGRWVLQDFGDVIVHIFHRETRSFYDLESLWADARRVKWKGAHRPNKDGQGAKAVAG